MELQPIIDQLSEMLTGYMPKLLLSLAILVGGWLVAVGLAAVVRAMLRRTTLDNKLAEWILGEKGRGFEIERWIAKGVYYLVLIFVLILFLRTLDLAVMAEPLNQFLNELSKFAPRILGGGLLLLMAWVVATLLKAGVSRGMKAIKFDERLGGQAGIDEKRRPTMTATLANAVYWLVFLLFLPAILGALALEGLLDPVSSMTDEILGFLPNLFAAVLILAVGYFIARIVQRIVSNLLSTIGTDQLGERVGLKHVLGDRGLSGLIGLIVYVMILIPVVITSLNALRLEGLTGPATDMLSRVMETVPALFAATILLGLAYVVGRLLAGMITSVLAGAGFDTMFSNLGLVKSTPGGERSPSAIAGYLTLVVVMLFAAIEAASLLGFEALAALVSQFTVFAGQVILGLIVFGVGLYLANLVAQTIQASSASQASCLALAARVSITILAGTIALRQMGLGNEIVSLAFGILLGAVAVAAALAFGLGGRDIAAKRLQKWLDAIDKRA
ncbi:MAG: mechanosensitive ion channel [Acidobacteriota bacterium]